MIYIFKCTLYSTRIGENTIDFVVDIEHCPMRHDNKIEIKKPQITEYSLLLADG